MAEVFQVKAIKPRRLRVKEFRLEILNALRAEGREVRRELKKVTKTWKGEKPDFEVLIGLTGTDATVLVGPTGSTKAVQKWVWVDEGTRGHFVPKTGRATMAFAPHYLRKTKPGVIGSQRGGPLGKIIVRTGRWWVRGIEPGRFSETIQERRRRKFTRRMVGAMKRANAKAFG